MDTTLRATQFNVINSTAANVWNVLTNPELIKQYLFGTQVTTDWKEGSAILFEGEWQGQQYRDKGKVLKYVPPMLLQYSYWTAFSGLEDKPENYSVVSYYLEEVNNQISLSVSQQGFACEETRQHTEISWEGVLKLIKELSEK